MYSYRNQKQCCNMSDGGKLLQVHEYGTLQQFVHWLQQAFKPVSILQIAHVNTAPYARAHTLQCHWSSDCAHGTDIVLARSSASRTPRITSGMRSGEWYCLQTQGQVVAWINVWCGINASAIVGLVVMGKMLTRDEVATLLRRRGPCVTPPLLLPAGLSTSAL
jgi:hypothetical protein